ncbi:nucleotidyltransferase family protein [Paenibacillus albus]|uniref:CBS domain-containing protein n=1 Tax=Paenibacillus albus TaxID=2495582 RepID=A0A3S8ZYH1_9BACL|nr:nucleotidyltransferase family protein [Paenibacillus albus]AZN38512.1 CBS domain-containing protein [Paenibacillus albus]
MRNWKSLLIKSEATLLETMRTLDAGAKQIVLVVDEYEVLLGTVTDGDIRRGLLRGESLSAPVFSVMNKRPVTAQLGDDRESLLALMSARKLHQLPIVDDRGRVVDIAFLDEYLQKEKKDNWVILMAGGLGTRLAPLTNNCPKPLLKVGSKPILEIIINNFIANGFYRFYISVNYKAEMIMDYFGNGEKWNIEIRYIREDQRLGTAGALSLLPERPADSIIVMNGDLLTKVNFNQALQFHTENNSRATMCVREYEYQVPYGVVNVNQHQISGIEEKPIQHFFINGGIYVLDPEVIDYIPRNRFYDMPSLFESLIASNQSTAAYPIREYWMDIGRMDDYERAVLDYKEV